MCSICGNLLPRTLHRIKQRLLSKHTLCVLGVTFSSRNSAILKIFLTAETLTLMCRSMPSKQINANYQCGSLKNEFRTVQNSCFQSSAGKNVLISATDTQQICLNSIFDYLEARTVTNSLQQKQVLSTAHQELNDACLLEKQWRFFSCCQCPGIYLRLSQPPIKRVQLFFEGMDRMI